MEPVFEKLYSYIFDIENAANSAANMDRQIPSAIFIVNFDKVWSEISTVLSLCLYSTVVI